MSIRRRIVIVICLIFLAISVLCFVFAYFTLFNGFKEIEDNQIKGDAINTENAFKNYLDNQSVKLSDWASWNDAYQYVLNKNPVFVETNLLPQSISQIGLNMVVFVNQEEQIVKAKWIDRNELIEVPFPKSFTAYFQKNKEKILTKNISDKNQGIIMLPEGALLFSAKPILTSNGNGPVHGTLIFGRLFDKKIIDYISGLTHLRTTVYKYSQTNIPQDFILAKNKLNNSSYFVNSLDISTVEGYFLLKDILGSPCLIVRLDASRDVYRQGVQTIIVIEVMEALVIIFAGFAFYLLLDKLIISKITKVSSDVSKIRKSQDPKLRVSVSGSENDEILKLANNINSMINELEKSKIHEKNERGQLALKMEELSEENKKLENAQKAIITVLEDSKKLEKELKKEKENVEKKIVERTKQLTDEQARLQASIGSLPIGFIMTDLNNNIVIINGIAKSILCVKSGNNFSGAVTKENLQHSNCDLNEIADRLKLSFDLKLAMERVIKDKKPFEIKELPLDDLFLHVFIIPIMEGKDLSVIGGVMLIENITEQKILDRSKDEFFSIASHELRTPLTAIRGNTSMILDYFADQLKDPQMKEMVDDVHESSVRLIEIVNDFLDTSRLELGKMIFKKDVIDLSALIPRVIKEYQVSGSRQKLYINFEPGENIPSVIADADRFRQVLINLVGNGMKFTEKGGITISLKLDGNFVKVLVADTGMGISKNSQNLLFRKFQQAENNIFTRDTTMGTGLGLYVSKMIVEGMGGRIQLEGSEIGKGTTFSFTLPVAK
jgi:signal transduction histidine kinase/sensor domain CHASE-containing protein